MKYKIIWLDILGGAYIISPDYVDFVKKTHQKFGFKFSYRQTKERQYITIKWTQNLSREDWRIKKHILELFPDAQCTSGFLSSKGGDYTFRINP